MNHLNEFLAYSQYTGDGLLLSVSVLGHKLEIQFWYTNYVRFCSDSHIYRISKALVKLFIGLMRLTDGFLLCL